MDKLHQIDLIHGALTDYQNGLMSLGKLIDKTEGLLAVIEDQSLKDVTFASRLALEEMYAATRMGDGDGPMEDFDFETQGRPIVDGAVQDILAKLDAWSSQQPPSQPED